MASGGSDNAFSLPSSASRSSKTFVDDYGMYIHFLGLNQNHNNIKCQIFIILFV